MTNSLDIAKEQYRILKYKTIDQMKEKVAECKRKNSKFSLFMTGNLDCQKYMAMNYFDDLNSSAFGPVTRELQRKDLTTEDKAELRTLGHDLLTIFKEYLYARDQINLQLADTLAQEESGLENIADNSPPQVIPNVIHLIWILDLKRIPYKYFANLKSVLANSVTQKTKIILWTDNPQLLNKELAYYDISLYSNRLELKNTNKLIASLTQYVSKTVALDLKEFIYSESVGNLANAASDVDILRILALLQGGRYLDLDLVVTADLGIVTAQNGYLITGEPGANTHPGSNNCVLASVANHPLLIELLNKIAIGYQFLKKNNLYACVGFIQNPAEKLNELRRAQNSPAFENYIEDCPEKLSAFLSMEPDKKQGFVFKLNKYHDDPAIAAKIHASLYCFISNHINEFGGERKNPFKTYRNPAFELKSLEGANGKEFILTGRDAASIKKYLAHNLFDLKRNQKNISETYNRRNLTIGITGPNIFEAQVLLHLQLKYNLQNKPQTLIKACQNYFFKWSYESTRNNTKKSGRIEDPFGIEPGHILYICDNSWLDKTTDKHKPRAEDDINIRKRTPWK